MSRGTGEGHVYQGEMRQYCHWGNGERAKVGDIEGMFGLAWWVEPRTATPNIQLHVNGLYVVISFCLLHAFSKIVLGVTA